MPSTSDVTNLQAAKSAYYANADYRVDGSSSKAFAFAAACRRLIGLLPKSGQHGGTGGEAYSFDLMTLQKEAKTAEDWAAKSAATSVAGNQISGTDFRFYRG